MHDRLRTYGWNDAFAAHFEPFANSGLICARVLAESRAAFKVMTGTGECEAAISGRLIHHSHNKADLPAVGDWVVVQPVKGENKGLIQSVLPRRTKFSRKVPGHRTDEQVIAANVDVVFLVTGLDRDFNKRRIERYLSLAWESGAQPVVILNKADLLDNGAEKQAEVQAIAMGAPVLLTSAELAYGIDDIAAFLKSDKTGALLGSSGVGKSTLLNRLLGENRQAVREVRSDDQRGRHTTTQRELFLLQSGGLMIDTPGLRELQLWDSGQGLLEAFEDVDGIAAQCRFRDCRHEEEPGCAVKAALESGEISQPRYQSFMKLQREMEHLERRKDEKATFFERRRERTQGKLYKKILREKSDERKGTS